MNLAASLFVLNHFFLSVGVALGSSRSSCNVAEVPTDIVDEIYPELCGTGGKGVIFGVDGPCCCIGDQAWGTAPRAPDSI